MAEEQGAQQAWRRTSPVEGERSPSGMMMSFFFFMLWFSWGKGSEKLGVRG